MELTVKDFRVRDKGNGFVEIVMNVSQTGEDPADAIAVRIKTRLAKSGDSIDQLKRTAVHNARACLEKLLD